MAGEVKPRDSQALLDYREKYEKQKSELKEKYESEIKNLRAEYKTQQENERASGEAVVNHIKSRNVEHRQLAEKDASRQEQAVDEYITKKSTYLNQRQREREQQLNLQENQYENMAKAKMENLRAQKQRIDGRYDQVLEESEKKGNQRITDLQKSNKQRVDQVESQGRQRIDALREEYDKKIRSSQEKGTETLRKIQLTQLDQMKQNKAKFRETMQEETLAHQDKIEKLRGANSEEIEDLRAESGKELAQKKAVREKQLQDEKKTHQELITKERDRFARTELTLKEKNEKELKRIEDQTNQKIAESKERQKQDMEILKKDFMDKSEALKARKEAEKQKLMAANQKELGDIQKGFDDRLHGQHKNFVEKFNRNNDIAKQTYSDQAFTLGKELASQKQKFVSASDRYAKKEDDPFYQIRDNKTKFYETSGAYVFEANVPAHEKNDITVRVKADKVIFQGNRSFADEVKEGDRIFRTNNIQTFNEEYPMIQKVEENKIMKSYEDGTLRVIIPKVTKKT